MISVIRHFDDGMQACMRLDDRVYSGWFAVDQGLRQRYVLAPSHSCLRCGGYKHGLHAFQGGQRYHERFGAPEDENGGGRAGGEKQPPES